MKTLLKVLTIFGTRPEAIKMAPIVHRLSCYQDEVINKVCVTAQHRQMLDQVLNLFQIEPDFDLNVMEKNQTPTRVAAEVLQRLEQVLLVEKPDWVLVQGDTTTAMAASISAFYGRIKVGHVEAGLRTYDRNQPFPEEINRRIAGVIADLHFAPTDLAANNLRQEQIPEEQILITGNTVIDAIQQAAEWPFDPKGTLLEKVPFSDKKIILVTAHRRENFGRPLKEICEALKIIAENHPEVHIVYPVHLNPNVWEPVHSILGGITNISLPPPLDYLPFVFLMRHAFFAITDSGGIQEEAPGLGVPVLVVRQITERPEAVEAGSVRLVGISRPNIVNEANKLLSDVKTYQQMAQARNPYGDGHAAERIVDALLGKTIKPWHFIH